MADKIKKPWLKNKEVEELLCREGEKVVFVDSAPIIPALMGVIQIVYILRSDNSYDIWFNKSDPKDPEVSKKSWEKHLSKVRPKRSAAMGHYDELRWSFLGKAERERRKGIEDIADRDQLRKATRFMYDLQKLRIAEGNRDSDQDEPAVLEDDDKTFLGRQSTGLLALEKNAEAEVLALLKKFPIYTDWLVHQTGCGTKMSGVLVSEIDIGNYREQSIKAWIEDLRAELAEGKVSEEDGDKIKDKIVKLSERLKNLKPCDTISALWAYCGLHVDPETGRAVSRQKGKKANWNSMLKTKVVFVLGGSLLVSGRKAGGTKWTELYDNYKNRKINEIVDECMVCEGLGCVIKKRIDGRTRQVAVKPDVPGSKTCYWCEGKCHDVPWGEGKKHIHNSAVRYMVKMFLAELWIEWRTLEGLPVTESYAEAKLGRKHGDHAPKRDKDPDDSED